MNNEPSPLTIEPAEPPKKRGLFSKLLPALVILIAAPFVIMYVPQAVDALKASRFTPSSQLASADQRIGFTGRGQQIFYATSPQIEDKIAFNQSCQSSERTAAILGCYYKDRIYLYNIQNDELDGTLEVTAAHEMLHAAYQRLNIIERGHVDDMVKAEYAKIKDQAAIKEIMKYYSQAEPGDEVNELHSIIGTTVRNLSPELESYYSRYFTDRGAVVALNQKYTEVFGKINEQANQLQQKIDEEGPKLKADLATYDADLQQLNLDVQSFNERAKSTGGFSSMSAFEAARTALVARVNTLNARRDALNIRVNDYNAQIESLNKLAVHANELNASINGASAPSGV